MKTFTRAPGNSTPAQKAIIGLPIMVYMNNGAKICTNIFSRTLSLPRREQFFERVARGKQ